MLIYSSNYLLDLSLYKLIGVSAFPLFIIYNLSGVLNNPKINFENMS